MQKRIIALSPAKRRKIVSLAKKHRMGSVRLFGSFARGEAGPKSDIDLLVKFTYPISLFDLVGIQDEFTETLGRKVDLVTNLSPHFEKYILPEVIPLYEKS